MIENLNSEHHRASQATAAFLHASGAGRCDASQSLAAFPGTACRDACTNVTDNDADNVTTDDTTAGVTTDSTSGPWYVCLTKPRQEAYAVSKLQEQDFAVYLPLHESWVRTASQWRKKQSVMFPRYAFVRPTKPGQSIGPVRSTPGVTCMVKFGPVLATLPPQLLAALKQAVALRSLAMPNQPFVKGQPVLFASGPLAGMQGIVSSVAAQRVMVLMQLLGQDQNVPVPFQDLKSVL